MSECVRVLFKLIFEEKEISSTIITSPFIWDQIMADAYGKISQLEHISASDLKENTWFRWCRYDAEFEETLDIVPDEIQNKEKLYLKIAWISSKRSKKIILSRSRF